MVMTLGIVAALGWMLATFVVGFFIGFCVACYAIKTREEDEDVEDDDEDEIEEPAAH